ncbi:MAG: hypothetical protein AB7G88_00470 [Thermomicrobiales bacterium]
MRPLSLAHALFAAVLLSLAATGVFAQNGPPPSDVTPGAADVTTVVLGGIDVAVAPGYRLVVAEVVIAPGGYVTRHIHASAIVVCVQSGSLGFTIHTGAATVTRGGTGAEPEATEPLEPNVEVVLEPRDCVSFDQFATHTEHTAWNAGDEPTVLTSTRLLKVDEPFTTFVDAQGTPVP